MKDRSTRDHNFWLNECINECTVSPFTLSKRRHAWFLILLKKTVEIGEGIYDLTGVSLNKPSFGRNCVLTWCAAREGDGPSRVHAHSVTLRDNDTYKATDRQTDRPCPARSSVNRMSSHTLTRVYIFLPKQRSQRTRWLTTIDLWLLLLLPMASQLSSSLGHHTVVSTRGTVVFATGPARTSPLAPSSSHVGLLWRQDCMGWNGTKCGYRGIKMAASSTVGQQGRPHCAFHRLLIIKAFSFPHVNKENESRWNNIMTQ